MNKFLKPALCLFLATAVIACKKKEVALPDNLINFEATTQGFDALEVLVKVNLSRAAEAAVPVTITLVPNKVTYGTEFTTDVAAVNHVISLTIPAGQTGTSFKVVKPATVFLTGDESIEFKLSSTGSSAVLGSNTNLKLSFSAITSDGAQLTLEGKTAASNYTNVVYADLSGNKQTPVDRKSWALGFYSGSDFKVVLNPAFQSMATVINKTDINAVTLADVKASKIYNVNLFDPLLTDGVSLVDFYTGDLTRTAIGNVSATEAENKVYVLGVNGQYAEPNLYKIRVLRNGQGYTLQYAKVEETTFKTVNVSKNADFNLIFVSLGNGTDGNIATVEPRKATWDLQWGYGTYRSVPTVAEANPYWFQDFVSINYLAGTQAAEVLTSTVSYTAFAEANIAGLTFKGDRDAIGDKWRVTTGTGIKTDRFYVIKDPVGNVYKLKFVSMGVGADGGERGRPVIEYKLVKKG